MYYCEKPAVVSPNNSANTAVFLPDRCPDPNAGLSQIVARAARLRHPSIGHYLINPTAGAAGDSDQIAEKAHRLTLEEFGVLLSPDERTYLLQSSGVEGVIRILDIARMKFGSNSETRDKVEKFACTLVHYSKSFDVICQQHTEWTALVWGSMRLVLQISLNYCSLFSGIATTLGRIGDNLGRLDMYLHIYPTNRMKNVCARLYAAIVSFFKNAIVFYKKSKWRKLLAAIKSPFEVKFKEVVDEVEWLINMVEKEALAMGLASMERQFSALAEWGLAVDYKMEMLADITSVGAATMLFELRTRLFQGHEMDATYHEEVMARYQLTSNPDWQTWFAEERKHVSWGHNTKSTLIYMQTDLVEPQLFLKWVALGQALAGRVPFAVLVWSPSMTARSALASLFHQVLAQRPDVLRSRSAAHYFENITNATTFEDLWDAFRQVLAGLPGFLCYITIPSIGPQEEVFAMRIVDLFNNWSGCSINLQLVTPVHASFPKPDGFIDIDAMYDVSPDLDTPDALHQIVLADLGFPERPSEQLHASLWQSLWRTVCYSVNALAVDALRTVITGCLPASPCSLKSWLQSPACEYHLQNTHLRLCLDQIPFTLPEDSKRRFAASLRDALWSCLGEGEWILPADFDTRKDRPGRLRTRQELWGAMRSVLARHDNAEFLPFAQEVAAMIKEIKKNETDGDVRDEFQRVINEVCAGATWKVACCSVGYAYRAAVEDAINMGLQRTVDCMLGDIVEHPVSSEW